MTLPLLSDNIKELFLVTIVSRCWNPLLTVTAVHASNLPPSLSSWNFRRLGHHSSNNGLPVDGQYFEQHAITAFRRILWQICKPWRIAVHSRFLLIPLQLCRLDVNVLPYKSALLWRFPCAWPCCFHCLGVPTHLPLPVRQKRCHFTVICVSIVFWLHMM